MQHDKREKDDATTQKQGGNQKQSQSGNQQSGQRQDGQERGRSYNDDRE